MILTKGNLEQYLKEKNLIRKNSKIIIENLSGGWLNPIFLVKTNNKKIVVKQTSDKGKKEQGLDKFYWPKDRMLNEHNALKICKFYAPEYVPSIIDVDFENFVQIIEFIDNSTLLHEYLKKKQLSPKTTDSIVKFISKIHKKNI